MQLGEKMNFIRHKDQIVNLEQVHFINKPDGNRIRFFTAAAMFVDFHFDTVGERDTYFDQLTQEEDELAAATALVNLLQDAEVVPEGTVWIEQPKKKKQEPKKKKKKEPKNAGAKKS